MERRMAAEMSTQTAITVKRIVAVMRSLSGGGEKPPEAFCLRGLRVIASLRLRQSGGPILVEPARRPVTLRPCLSASLPFLCPICVFSLPPLPQMSLAVP